MACRRATHDGQGAETYTLHIARLTLIDTAEESVQWAERARAQWGGRHPLAIRVTSGAVVRGRTVARELVFDTQRGWSGVSWCARGGVDGGDDKDKSNKTTTSNNNNTKKADNNNNTTSSGHGSDNNRSSPCDEQHTSAAHAGGIDVPLQCNPVLLLEVVSVHTHHSSHHSCSSSVSVSSSSSSNRGGDAVEERVVGVGVLSAQAMLCESRQFARFCVHVLPTHTAIDSDTVHAIAEVELHSSLLEERPENNYTPLEYNYGAVRVSTIDLYYPPFLLTGTGAYIVSNVVCVMNMTESSALAMQLVPLGAARRCLVAEPHAIITVRPQQRVYFSATWALTQRALMCPMQMQLRVNGLQQVSAPIVLQVHVAVPQPTTTDIAYHYWVNTTCVTNRAMLCAQELPRIRAILPIHRLVSRGAGLWRGNSGGGGGGGGAVLVPTHEYKQRQQQPQQQQQQLAATSTAPGSEQGHRCGGGDGPAADAAAPSPSATATAVTRSSLVYDMRGGDDDDDDDDDAVAAAAVAAAAAATTAAAAATTTPSASLTRAEAEAEALMLCNASFVVQNPRSRYGAFVPRGPVLDLYQRTCMCTITLGTIRGFPIVYESVTGVSPSFQVSVTLLDQRGWHVLRGDTLPSYQSASGSLHWSERLVLRKWPGAQSTQFVRLNLTEVRARDGDETPIGAGLISLPSMHCICARNTLAVAFHVYETYSLYDQLTSPSLLMKGVVVTFSKVR